MSTSKGKYQEFCDQSDLPLIFQTPRWLDATAGTNNWDVVLFFNGTNLTGALPFVTNSKFGLKQITLPILTPYLGPIIIFPKDLKEQNRLSFKKKVILGLISQLPEVDRFATHTDFNFDYWLPFYWEGYKQTTRYSFVLDTSPVESTLFSNFKPNIKKHIKNSESKFSIIEGDHIQDLFDLHEADMQKKSIKLLYTRKQAEHLDRSLQTTRSRKILYAINERNEIICGFYLVFDSQYAHYLIGAVRDEERNSGVMSLLIWQSILEAKKRGLQFNFEGSMNKNIEKFFASFGGTPTPYMLISKTSNKWLKHFTRFNH